MKQSVKLFSLLLAALMLLSLCACGAGEGGAKPALDSLEITNCDKTTLAVDYTLQLQTNAPAELRPSLKWSASSDAVTVDSTGFVIARSVGSATVTVSYGSLKDTVIITVVDGDGVTVDSAPVADSSAAEESGTFTESLGQPDYSGTDGDPGGITNDSSAADSSAAEEESGLPVDETARAEFYNGADPAESHEEALARSKRGELSGALWVPDQAPVLSEYMPEEDGVYIRNSEPYFIDDNTFVVVNAYGEEVFRVYRGGGYITLEEVSAYIYAFGDVPANYVSDKSKSPSASIWGENLRLNHSKFSGNTSKFPYEPLLPEIKYYDGDLQYYELDIGTTGTDCDPVYPSRLYNDGYRITRGAARIVYTRFDANGDEIIDPNEKYLFYTYNHYNDFQEYLGYYCGWGEMFGNITGGGKLSDKNNCNPTPYVPSRLGELERVPVTVGFFDFPVSLAA